MNKKPTLVKKNKNFRTLFVVVTTVLLLAILAGKRFYTPSVLKSLIIETRTLPVLRAHGHFIGDSLFDTGHASTIDSVIYRTPQDMWVKSFDIKVINGNPRSLHHLMLVRLDKRDVLCPNYGWEMIMTASAENSNSHQEFPDNYRLFLPKGTPLFLWSMLHNPFPPVGPGGTYRNVKVQVTVNVDDSNRQDGGFKSVEPFRLHLADAPCTNNIGHGETFDVPPGETSYIKKIDDPSSPSNYSFTQRGTIVATGGHIHPHDGGKSLDVYINKNLFHSFRPKLLTHEPWSWSIDPYFKKIHVAKGDVINIIANYSNPNSTPVRGAMGMAVFYFAKD